MTTLQEILDAAQSLPTGERARLIYALWDTVQPKDWAPPSPEWVAEAQRRSEECDAGRMTAAPWPEVRDRATARLAWMVRVVLSSAAERDYTEALCWYAERSIRAAEDFDSELAQSLETIATDPERFPHCDARHRYYLMRRYPFQIIFRPQGEDILVVALAHANETNVLGRSLNLTGLSRAELGAAAVQLALQPLHD